MTGLNLLRPRATDLTAPRKTGTIRPAGRNADQTTNQETKETMPETQETLNRVMVIAAHPDDPEFGCAGTVFKWAQGGKHITYVLLTSGELRPVGLAGDDDVDVGRSDLARPDQPEVVVAGLGDRRQAPGDPDAVGPHRGDDRPVMG